ncbi:MAG: zf-HC2 domain-containing protein [Planctomycetes bacterium]|nr:zf-HC2 domain-containing protein [Planctomycetota bacterium]
MTKKDCDALREGIVPLLDGELEGPEARALRDHLAACPACRQVMADEEALWRLLGEETGATVDLLPRVRAGIARHRRRVRLLRMASVAAGILILALWAGVALRGPSVPEPSPPGGDVIADLDVVEALAPLPPTAIEILRSLDLDYVDVLPRVEIPEGETDPWEIENI